MRNRADIPSRAKWVLTLILVAFGLILFRIWHLTHVQYDQKVEEARRPQQRLTMEAAKRGTIRDRFNLPLAINRVQYNIGILYSEIRQVPAVKWIRDENGKRQRLYKRKEYVIKLSQLLAQELDLDAERIEDLIYSKAALYGQVPYILKEDISEEQFFRLNMLAKDWLGIHVQRVPRRHYPKGKVAAEVIGYMGAINREEYDGIMRELKELRAFQEAEIQGEMLDFPPNCHSSRDVQKRLLDLEEYAYRFNDYVGKAGVEYQFEELLRGFQGRKAYLSDSKGNFLRELPGSRSPTSGQRLLLSISSELQEYAEELLIQNEQIRKPRIAGAGTPAEPWIKGGAIVVMDPNNGEVLALASYPRFDPNDFSVTGRRTAVKRWFETESFLGEVWDQKQSLERENPNDIETVTLDWDEYLHRILPAKSFVKETIAKIGNIENAVAIQRAAERLYELSGQENFYSVLNYLYHGEEHFGYGSPPPAHIQAEMEDAFAENTAEVKQCHRQLNRWLSHVSHNYDKALIIDLCRVAVDANLFDEELLQSVGATSLSHFRDLSASMSHLKGAIKEIIKEHFHATTFRSWRKENGKQFLKELREVEKKEKRYAKPYLDYFDREERRMFDAFWADYQWHFLTFFLTGSPLASGVEEYDAQLGLWMHELNQGAHRALPWYGSFRLLQRTIAPLSIDDASYYLRTFRGFQDLIRPLYGKYRYQRNSRGQQLEKHLALAFYPIYGYGHARSHAFRQGTPPGSIFKLVTSYKVLMQRYHQLGQQHPTFDALNPLVIVDQPHKRGEQRYVGYHANGTPISQSYKGGRLMKSVSSAIGRVDIIGAIEASSNPYFSMLAGDILDDPTELQQGALDLAFGERTGIELPWETVGKVPNDLDINRTGLYTMANGQHTLLVTPLQTAVMLSSIANGGHIFKPKIVKLSAGHLPNREKSLENWPADYPYRESLERVGIDFPLFTKPLGKEQKQAIHYWQTREKHQLFMPDVVRRVLLEGMRKVVVRQGKLGIYSLSQLYKDDPGAISDLLEIHPYFVGKSSTAERMENLNLDLYNGTGMYNHIWFGGISYKEKVKKQVSHGHISRDPLDQAELVVVVYLPYGSFGKDALPVAAQMVKKWREINQ